MKDQICPRQLGGNVMATKRHIIELIETTEHMTNKKNS